MVSASNFVSVDKDVLSTSTYGFLPKLAVIPLCEDYSESYEILVSEGDKVEEGQVIARSAGLYIHSSIPGIVKKIERRQYSNGKQGLAAVISLKGEFSFLGKKQIAQEWRNYDSITVQFLLKEAGFKILFVEEILSYDGKEFLLPEITADQLTHILYTSGSTGVPKGVRHNALSDATMVCTENGDAALYEFFNCKKICMSLTQISFALLREAFRCLACPPIPTTAKTSTTCRTT